MKIWYRDSDKTKVISFNKSVGESGEGTFDASPLQEMDHDFYEIQWSGANPGDGVPSLNRLSQAVIDAIVAVREQTVIDYQQKHTDAKAQLKLNDLAGKTYAQVQTFVDNKISDSGTNEVVKKMAVILLALLKEQDFSD